MIDSYDGKAGAAAIALLDSSDEAGFISHFYKSLRRTGTPAYAMPRLIRITKELRFSPSLHSVLGGCQLMNALAE